ncbi:helix-turn-helix domain-containing protein [Pandoraea norimbergensis]|uniref:AraC family transcriptional regulator n=1 Tax=Pandoraea norimbergensis TaxID=93219 RepID=A0ABM5WHJ1_9BURK|nr:helix-turn-helix domain-containing protein [Pandoraea norimbergensis]ALS59740.1 AraC family transcriptional regulator [Pandoraea norimbergensis]
MTSRLPSNLSPCPDRYARAPLVACGGPVPHTRLYPPSAALYGAVMAVVCRDIRHVALTDAQRLSHFPASPVVCLTVYQGFDVGLVHDTPAGPRWTPHGTRVTLSGSQSMPTTTWATTGGRGVMVCFPANVAKVLFDVNLSVIQDRFVCAWEALADDWHPFLDAFADAPDDAATMAVLDHYLGPRWQALQPERSALTSLRLAGQRWVEGLAFQALQWRQTHSPRQVERRIKMHTGRSLREWQALVKTEGVFFAARDRLAAGEAFDWAEMAQDEGFADQAHMSRMAKRITGFAPTEFTQRYREDESFWLYRLWV